MMKFMACNWLNWEMSVVTWEGGDGSRESSGTSGLVQLQSALGLREQLVHGLVLDHESLLGSPLEYGEGLRVGEGLVVGDVVGDVAEQNQGVDLEGGFLAQIYQLHEVPGAGGGDDGLGMVHVEVVLRAGELGEGDDGLPGDVLFLLVEEANQRGDHSGLRGSEGP